MVNDIWKQYTVDTGKPPLHLVLGPLHVWMQRKYEEIWITHLYEHEARVDLKTNSEPPGDLSWSRWTHKSEPDQLTVSPVFPDLPIVVSPEYPMTISPGTRIQIFTRIPVWMRIGLSNVDYILKEIPSIILSRTWFGTPMEGELCYWSTTKARRTLENVEVRPYLANCPIWITNKSDKDLHFEKFCFRVERLGIHLYEDSLWAGETRIVHHGEDLNSDITMTGKLPDNMGRGQQLSKPRNAVRTSFATRTFKKLFDETFISAR